MVGSGMSVRLKLAVAAGFVSLFALVQALVNYPQTDEVAALPYQYTIN